MSAETHMEMSHPSSYRRANDSIQDCIRNCLDCYQACLETYTYCLRREPITDAEKLLTLSGCADIVRTCADFLIASSPLHPVVCDACAEICEVCADECEGLGEEEIVQRCIDACRRCSESCDAMAVG